MKKHLKWIWLFSHRIKEECSNQLVSSSSLSLHLLLNCYSTCLHSRVISLRFRSTCTSTYSSGITLQHLKRHIMFIIPERRKYSSLSFLWECLKSLIIMHCVTLQVLCRFLFCFSFIYHTTKLPGTLLVNIRQKQMSVPAVDFSVHLHIFSGNHRSILVSPGCKQ